jgi:hypothetical protein
MPRTTPYKHKHFKKSCMQPHQRPQDQIQRRIDFAAVKTAALPVVPALVKRWLPDGRCEAHEWVARNPRRNDHSLGSFKINLRTGRWADFATNDKGGDVISLAAYLFDLPQVEAAQHIATMLGIMEVRRG